MLYACDGSLDNALLEVQDIKRFNRNTTTLLNNFLYFFFCSFSLLQKSRFIRRRIHFGTAVWVAASTIGILYFLPMVVAQHYDLYVRCLFVSVCNVGSRFSFSTQKTLCFVFCSQLIIFNFFFQFLTFLPIWSFFDNFKFPKF